MKKLALLLFVCLGTCLAYTSEAQVLFFDTSIPQAGSNLNIGGRATLFTPVDPNVQIGMTVRAHRFYMEGEGDTGIRAFSEASIGAGMKYTFIRDGNGYNMFYVNPNIELNVFQQDHGIDLSGAIGFSKVLVGNFSINIEMGIRGKMMGYELPEAVNNRFRGYAGIGVGYTLPNWFGGKDPVLRGEE